RPAWALRPSTPSASPPRATAAARSRSAWLRSWSLPTAITLALRLRDRLGQPAWNPGRAVRADGDAGVRRPPLGHALALALDEIVETEPCAPDFAAAGADRQPVVE